MPSAEYARQNARARALGYASYYQERKAVAQARGFTGPYQQTRATSQRIEGTAGFPNFAARMRSQGHTRGEIYDRWAKATAEAARRGYKGPNWSLIRDELLDAGAIDDDEDYDYE